MKRNKASLAFVMALAVLLAGCVNAPAAVMPEATQSVAAEAPTAAPEQADEASAREIAAFAAALETLYTQHVLPDGTDCGYDESMPLSDNQFAICDVDGDGKDELMLSYVTTFTAGQTQAIYAFDEESGALRAELSEYPLWTIYDNGVIRADWSHNQGLAGAFWPYTLYRYDAAQDAYANVGMVDAWDKTFAQTNGEGAAFPDETDVSGTGIVYYIMTGGAYESVAPVDVAAYEAWRDTFLSGAAEMQFASTPLTSEAIDALKQR